MSDSELSEASQTPAPPDDELERSLRREVVKAVKSGDEYSYNSIRAASEVKLGLTKGFYKAHEDWAQRSKRVIDDQLVYTFHYRSFALRRQLTLVKAIQNDGPSSPPPKKPEPTPTERAKKRTSTKKQPAPRKRQKTTPKKDDSSEELSSPLSDIDSEVVAEKPKGKPHKAPQKSSDSNPKATTSKRTRVAESEDDEIEKDANGAAEEEPPEPEETKDAASDSESELSVLLDEEPPAKKKRQPKESTGQKSKKTKAAVKGKSDADLDPDQAEIKRLQGWLVKCGIRKLWGKELKPFETSKAKIKHLREMLADVGMTGRYSIEKASQIREARELAADIEAVQEGAERWGADDASGGREQKKDDDSRPARRLVRGAKNYDFLSSDGEETD